MRIRTKSKSGWEAEGKPTSISLKPIFTSVSNMRRLRSGSMGSMSAWLPSLRSTEHQRGALTSFLSGQVRSRSSSGTNGRYLSNGIGFGVTGLGGISSSSWKRKNLLATQAQEVSGERWKRARRYISRRPNSGLIAVDTASQAPALSTPFPGPHH
jgi:hypothetical protein